MSGQRKILSHDVTDALGYTPLRDLQGVEAGKAMVGQVSLTKILDEAEGALMRTGGTMSGALYLVGDPTDSTSATTKSYVDGKDAATLASAKAYSDTIGTSAKAYTDTAVAAVKATSTTTPATTTHQRPALADFALVYNDTGSTGAEISGGPIVAMVPAGKCRAYTAAIANPSQPWTFYTRLSVGGVDGVATANAFVESSSAYGRIQCVYFTGKTLGIYYAGTYNGYSFESKSYTGTSGKSTLSISGPTPHLWMAIRFDGANLIFGYSPDGYAYTWFFKLPLAANALNAGFDRAGWLCNSNESNPDGNSLVATTSLSDFYVSHP